MQWGRCYAVFGRGELGLSHMKESFPINVIVKSPANHSTQLVTPQKAQVHKMFSLVLMSSMRQGSRLPRFPQKKKNPWDSSVDFWSWSLE